LPGLLLRQIKDFWRVALFTSTLLNPALDPSNENLDVSEGLDRRRDMFLRTESAITQLGNPRIFPSVVSYNRIFLVLCFIAFVFFPLGLDGVWKTKPLLDGKAIMGVLQLKSGGPTIGQWVRVIFFSYLFIYLIC
jgi:hypothetical protein